MRDSWVRASLGLSVPINLGVGYVLARPAAWPGTALGLSSQPGPVYVALSVFFIGFFGLVYLTLACQTRIDRSVLFVGASGKLGVFLLALWLRWQTLISMSLFFLSSLDLILAALWFSWLALSRRQDD